MVSPQVTNLAIMLVMMQVSKQVPFEDPDVITWVRIGYVVSNLIVAGIYLYITAQVKNKNDNTPLEYVEPPPPGSGEDPKPVTTTVRDYDLTKLRTLWKSQAMGVLMMAVMHLYFKFSNPLLIQSILPIKSALEQNLAKVHIFNRSATGDLKRPWKDANPFGSFGGGDVKTDPLSIKKAKENARGRVKED